MTTTEERTGIGAIRRDYDEIVDALSAAGRSDLAERFDNMMGDVANECFDQATAAALGGMVIEGTVVLHGLPSDRIAARIEIPTAAGRGTGVTMLELCGELRDLLARVYDCFDAEDEGLPATVRRPGGA